MNTLSSRILASHVVFVLTLVAITFLTTRYIERASHIRNLQSKISLTNTEVLTLINRDIVLRTEFTKDTRFYNDSTFQALKNRNEHFKTIEYDLETLVKNEAVSSFDIEDHVLKIGSLFQDYERLHQKFILLQYRRGFKDDGLEGTMRESAHRLEEYPEEIKLSDLLSLRRHEKDFFLRGDAVYVQLLNHRVAQIISYVKRRDTQLSLLVLGQLENYVSNFNEIVAIEKEMGDHSSGLIGEISRKKTQTIESFAALSSEVNVQANTLIDGLIRRYSIFVISGLLFMMVLGYLSAGFVTRSIGRLAKSMKEAILNKYETPSWKPNRLSSEETKSLYLSYTNLLSTIKGQVEKLEESNAIKDRFFSIIGHDLRGPMANLTMSLHLWSDGVEKYSKKEAVLFAGKMLKSVAAISLLLDNLLHWSQTQVDSLSPDKEELIVADIVRDIKSLHLQRIENKQITIDNCIENDLKVLGDKNMMELVLRNLIHNAIKFTSVGGVIKIYSSNPAGKINIHVADNGIGIDTIEQEFLFTLLSKKRSVGTNGERGSGLGLVLASDFVRKHDGSLTVISEKNVGSTFTICLPVVEGVFEAKPV